MQKDINFYSSLKEVKAKQSVSPVVIILMIVVVLSIASIIGVGSLIKSANDLVIADVEAARSYLTDPNNKIYVKEVLEKRALVSNYEKYGSLTGEYYDDYYTYPVLSSSTFKAISASMPEDVKVVKYEYQDSTNVLLLECTCEKEVSPPIFTNALKETGIFTEVLYTGYKVDQQTGKLEFVLGCVFKGGDK